VLAELPAWAREKTVTDTAGNLVLALGPDRDTSVVIAHMDEIGFEVTRISPDGTVSLAQRGGFFPSLWEGQTALLHVGEPPSSTRVDDACGAATGGPIRGVFVPRDSAVRKQPTALGDARRHRLMRRRKGCRCRLDCNLLPATGGQKQDRRTCELLPPNHGSTPCECRPYCPHDADDCRKHQDPDHHRQHASDQRDRKQHW